MLPVDVPVPISVVFAAASLLIRMVPVVVKPVVNVGLSENTILEDVVPVAPLAVYPVILLKAVIPAELAFVPPLATGNTPVTPVVNGKPVKLVATPDAGVPKAGATKTALSENTALPEPVSSVIAPAKFAEDGVAKNVATPAPKPLMPLPTGRLVPLVRSTLDGVPKSGVVNAGLSENTIFEAVLPVAPVAV